MGRIQLYVSDEMETYLQETFGSNKSRIIDALIFDLSNGKPLSPEGIARAMDRKTYSTSNPKSSSSKKPSPFRRKKKVEENKDTVRTDLPEPVPAQDIPGPVAMREEEARTASSAIPQPVSASSDNPAPSSKGPVVNPTLLAKGLAGFSIS